MDSTEKATAILLSYKREKNIEKIAKTILACSCIEKLIVSNNNPDVDIHQWLKIENPRLEIISQTEHKECAIRWDIAKNSGAKFIIAVDDDIFLSPQILTSLFRALQKDPVRPHGVFGSDWEVTQDSKGILNCVLNHTWGGDKVVDCIHKVYAVTSEHVSNYYNICALINQLAPAIGESIEEHGDDIIISHSGLAKPMIHGFGEFKDCETANEDGIANCAKGDFPSRRAFIYYVLQQYLKSLTQED